MLSKNMIMVLWCQIGLPDFLIGQSFPGDSESFVPPVASYPAAPDGSCGSMYTKIILSYYDWTSIHWRIPLIQVMFFFSSSTTGEQ